jgi:hypothetical protein
VSLSVGAPAGDEDLWGEAVATPRVAGAVAPLLLDSLGYGVEGLEAIVVLHLGDAHVHAAFVRDGAGLSPAELSAGFRDAYRASQLAMRRLAGDAAARSGAGRRASSMPPGARERADELPAAVVTVEVEGRTALLRRVRSYAVAFLFDGAMPLGMARLLAQRLTARLSPELPSDAEPAEEPVRGSARPPLPQKAPSNAPVRRAGGTPPPPSARSVEAERTRRLLAILDLRAPEPHVARLRLSLRAGLTPLALERPEELGSEAMLLIETAVEDILGLDRATLRRLV